jgi:hypothetical protein
MLWGFLCLFKIETMCKWLRFNSKKASNAVRNCQICKCSFSTKIGTSKLGRISTENQSQTSNREGSRATTLALFVYFAVAIVKNKLSHLSDRVCNFCWRRKVRNLFQLCHLVKNSTKEESVQSPDRFVSNGNYSVFCFALLAKPCKSQSVSNRLTCNCL